MKRLRPPFELLEEIGYRKTEILGYFATPKGIKVKMDIPTYATKKFYRMYAVMFIAAVKEHFGVRIATSSINWREIEAFLNYIALAVLDNAAKHGNKRDPSKKILLGLWFGEKGVLVGVGDEGDFYNRASVKEAIRKKKRLPSKKDISDFDIIYEADQVSTFGGALYVTILIDSLAP